MPVEIERKFLVRAGFIPPKGLRPTTIMQGYLHRGPTSVRVRWSTRDGARKATITVKGPGTLVRQEHEMELPPEMAEDILKDCSRVIAKMRYRIGRWELDWFGNVKAPNSESLLWLAEIELQSPKEQIELPEWVGKEVTDDVSFTNASLVERATFNPMREAKCG